MSVLSWGILVSGHCNYPLTINFLVMTTCAIQPCCRLLPLFQAQRCTFEISGRQIGVLPVALQAPSHGEWRILPDTIHSFHGAVTLLAGNTGLHVLAMVEINKIGQVVDLYPLDRLLPLNRFLELFNFNRLLFKHVMAVHAHAGRRDSCMAAGASREMTVEAGNLVVSGMFFVRKRDRLLRRIALVQSDPGEFPGSAASGEDQPNDTDEHELGAHAI
jgi:hypothetical protein